MRLATLLSLAVALAGCNSDTVTATALPLAPDLLASVTTALQDEYHAEVTYLRVLQDFGNAIPFQNVVNAEQRHSAALAGILERRAMGVPASSWTLDNVPRFATLATACAGAAEAEIENIALYDRLLTSRDLPQDVSNVFSNNRRASLEKHLPAFQACR